MCEMFIAMFVLCRRFYQHGFAEVRHVLIKIRPIPNNQIRSLPNACLGIRKGCSATAVFERVFSTAPLVSGMMGQPMFARSRQLFREFRAVRLQALWGNRLAIL